MVEDNPADVFLLKEALRTHGVQFHLDWFADGEQAAAHIERIAENPNLQLILLDLNLPKVDGKELLARIRSHPMLSGTPVAILTSSDSPQDRADTARLGANCYIQKPPSLDEFLHLGVTLRELLSRQAA